MATRPTKKPAAKKTITLTTGIDVEVSRVEALVDKIVQDRLKVILEEKLGDVVAGEFAEMRLHGKTPPVLVDLIDRRLKVVVRECIDNTVTQYAMHKRIREEAHIAVHKAIGNGTRAVDKAYADALEGLSQRIRNGVRIP